MMEGIKLDRIFMIYLGYLMIGWIVWMILYFRVKKKGKNVKKKLIRITAIQGALAGLVLSIISQATILVSLLIIISFGFIGYTAMTSSFRIRETLGKKD
ncbi:hypothetical protein [Neobacillus sp. OS1-33]|jgi:hypothetical protein|uniref:hypothetical protein n=1 Tax=Neobacillus sp. OS1-33 TaxID=3070683 RepID=UPI0027E1671D|nr:hypothetical protein [Neobacillus sp. OS1-33]WML27342.1 hypothetical protein RCG22_06905 [Neobacillus sp. OS1-33]